jgi:hypothetical protein
MKLFRETTKDWQVPQANHAYVLSDDKQWMYGYVKAGTRDLITFKKRIQFNTRYRTFVELRKGQI